MSVDIATQVGDWLPTNQAYLARWLDEFIEQVEEDKRVARGPRELADPLKNFREFVYDNPEIYVLFTDMFEQLSLKVTPTGYPQVKSFEHMLELIDKVIKTVPTYNESGLVGFPINVILNWAMGTQAGFAAFLNKEVNTQLKPVLDEWATYLKSFESAKAMEAGGWLSPKALEAMTDPGMKFDDLFQCNPRELYYGFTSWNHFFTRNFKNPEKDRPVAKGDDVVVSACEASPYRVSRKVKLHDHFSVKGQPYSLAHLLDTAHKGVGEPDAEEFVGGTVYQGFLKALNYHQWHSPVKGKVVACRKIPGSYYSEAPSALCDAAAPDISQGYISHVATRALIFIAADNKKIGTLCFVGIGMAEVSSCNLTVEPGDSVVKGQKLGEFQYGGSSHCLVFKPGVELDFIDDVKNINRDNPKTVRVNAELAKVKQ
ncbi:phosphatidylserine decarboxylase family protein [Saccharothrix deserti]|uniref:phosphatidylserine decarboxylase family protein n=1 Tax=Saccharothrix deserti TaxID=2593674 RepID=UPI00131C21FB|nr:phosphatidylserine decarboxylase family protein [Saccharothrix deserti]